MVRTRWRHAARPVRRRLGRARAPRQIRCYLATAEVPRLHLGAGDNLLDGWLNTDRDPIDGAVHLDVARPFPAPDGVFRYVTSEHLVEHVPYATALAMLRESHRVLVPGGRIRIATPDLRALTSLLDGPDRDVGDRYARWLRDSYFPHANGPAAVFALNQVLRGWGHQFVFDFATLRDTLAASGFADVVRRPFRDSDDPQLARLEAHGVADGNEDLTRFETLVVEARRPAGDETPRRSAGVAARA